MSTQTIVITGSTRGIGKGLAVEFLKRGHQVVVTGRSQEAVDRAVEELSPNGPVIGRPCDVRDFDAVQAVWDAGVERFGRIDMWINNAAVATENRLTAELDPKQIAATVDTNLTGTMFGTRVALAGMLKQGGRGRIYMFEGFGSNGMMRPGLATYGATKRALRYYTAAVAAECKDTPVLIGSLSPGIVVTDLLIYSSKNEDPAKWEKSKRFLNILGDTVDVVTPWLAEQALASEKQGAMIAWLTTAKSMGRFAGAFLLGRRRDIISEAEARLEKEGHTGI
ncbi:MAG: SDR family oxidoreductase [Chromatiales bacterium]|nr:SDR family oxidoreductase [Chromatiales bacterium]